MRTEDSDADLLVAWLDGERQAGQALIERHYDTVFLFFHARLDPDSAAELTQATFETLCESGHKYRGASSFRAYLLGIGRWKLVAHYRRAEVQRAAPEPYDDSFTQPVDDRSLTSIWAARERESVVVEALRCLALDHQILLELKEYEGFTAREIAEVFGIPAGTVATRLRRARSLLAQHVESVSGSVALAQTTSTTLQEHLHQIRSAYKARLRPGGR